jgi:hypothetical protein
MSAKYGVQGSGLRVERNDINSPEGNNVSRET